ncbi:MAG: type II secretion system protein [Cyanobacteria bacterium TGS_CYA1]|nr:type II secretion system protein [Cyanobacteria bacterium TGS_CYA1]
MHRQNGISLVESVISVGLSGIFIVMLSTMLAQTLQLMRANHDELIAISAAELLIENAKTTPYSTLKNLASTGTPFVLQINKKKSDSPLRISPVQIDLEDSSKVFGAVDGSSGNLTISNKWQLNSGNFFDAEATEEVIDSTTETGNLDSIKVVVTVAYKATSANNTSAYSKKLIRKAYVFAEGGDFE